MGIKPIVKRIALISGLYFERSLGKQEKIGDTGNYCTRTGVIIALLEVTEGATPIINQSKPKENDCIHSYSPAFAAFWRRSTQGCEDLADIEKFLAQTIV